MKAIILILFICTSSAQIVTNVISKFEYFELTSPIGRMVENKTFQINWKCPTTNCTGNLQYLPHIKAILVSDISQSAAEHPEARMRWDSNPDWYPRILRGYTNFYLLYPELKFTNQYLHFCPVCTNAVFLEGKYPREYTEHTFLKP